VWGILRPEVGDGYGWWGIFPIVGMGMGKSYPMVMYPLPSLSVGGNHAETRPLAKYANSDKAMLDLDLKATDRDETYSLCL
jgi:hypothetical protein